MNLLDETLLFHLTSRIRKDMTSVGSLKEYAALVCFGVEETTIGKPCPMRLITCTQEQQARLQEYAKVKIIIIVIKNIPHTLKASSSVLSSPIYIERTLFEVSKPRVSSKYCRARPLSQSTLGRISITFSRKSSNDVDNAKDHGQVFKTMSKLCLKLFFSFSFFHYLFP